MILALACVEPPEAADSPALPLPALAADTPAMLCASWHNRIEVDLPWGDGVVYTRDHAEEFGAETVLVARTVVPDGVEDSHGAYGGAYVAEYGGPATWRDIRISRFACDFRAVDETGEDGPISAGSGTSAASFFTVGSDGGPYPALQAGEAWFVNVRNWNPNTGAPSCDGTACDVALTLNPP